MTTQDLLSELERIRNLAHNGLDVYNQIVQLISEVERSRIDGDSWKNHSDFISSVLDGESPESAWVKLQEQEDLLQSK